MSMGMMLKLAKYLGTEKIPTIKIEQVTRARPRVQWVELNTSNDKKDILLNRWLPLSWKDKASYAPTQFLQKEWTSFDHPIMRIRDENDRIYEVLPYLDLEKSHVLKLIGKTLGEIALKRTVGENWRNFDENTEILYVTILELWPKYSKLVLTILLPLVQVSWEQFRSVSEGYARGMTFQPNSVILLPVIQTCLPEPRDHIPYSLNFYHQIIYLESQMSEFYSYCISIQDQIDSTKQTSSILSQGICPISNVKKISTNRQLVSNPWSTTKSYWFLSTFPVNEQVGLTGHFLADISAILRPCYDWEKRFSIFPTPYKSEG
ncbi:hypothetical protein OUZ56_020765 [Daphnia magna]|uniref:Uncharacterized protein n=1 Tax=Daphnia magna TaxID=35525 RepID=A0ABQ9ZGH0_9CRUS|nr:hypothetical protein OUZ56_020765 [Daphnia magna]